MGIRLASSPPTEIVVPSRRMAAGEFLSGIQLLRLAARSLRLGRAPSGTGRPVVCVPGLGTPDAFLAPLRGYLRALGHDARPAGLGTIGRDVRPQAERLGGRVAALARNGAAVNLVGWSIGGVIAREVARDHPDSVDRVVTFGTPVIGGPTHTRAAKRYEAAELSSIHAEIEQRNQVPIAVPITAIWSRRDGIVSPGACLDRQSPSVEHVEVSSTHVGLGVDPDVWHVIAQRLAATGG